MEETKNFFKPRARIIRIIGEELISSDLIAIIELVKNSYDADAPRVEIELNDILTDNGEIIIRDFGNGMDYEKITKVWLEPATPDKRKRRGKKEYTYSKIFGRRYLGEKGIGRFAAHRLGNTIELISRGKEFNEESGEYIGLYNHETKVEIDWEEFDEETYLDKVPVKVDKIDEPKLFLDTSGTSIRISTQKPWTENQLKNTIVKLRSLESPIKPQSEDIVFNKGGEAEDPGFSVKLTSNDDTVNEIIREVPDINEVLEKSFYHFHAIIDETGEMIYDYEFKRPDVPDQKRDVKDETVNLCDGDVEFYEKNSLNETTSPGLFELNLHVWDLDTPLLKMFNLKKIADNFIKPNAGVRIYRDNFRVWPYGDQDDDWLGMDLKRLNAPKERKVSKNQVIGFVHISSVNNPKLQDQSNREGLICNDQLDHFTMLVQSAMSTFATERKKDKVLIEKLTEKSKPQDVVTSAISNVKNKVIKNNHEDFYLKDMDSLEKVYRTKIDEVLERYMMAAAIGITNTVPFHEIKSRIHDINDLVKELEKTPDGYEKFLRELTGLLGNTNEIVDSVSAMMSRQKKKKMSFKKIINNQLVVKRREFKKYGIHVDNIIGDEEVNVVPGLLNSAIINIIDNAIYWLRIKASKIQNNSYTPTIIFSSFVDENNIPVLTIEDNGTGLKDGIELLVEPYYSHRNDGLGLGLYLANEIMQKHDGVLDGYNRIKGLDETIGAVIEFRFGKVKGDTHV